MDPFTPRLTQATLDLDRAINALERAIIDRNVLEKRIEQSWKKLSAVMKALDRKWDHARHASYRRLHAKHSALQRSLTTAQVVCTNRRQDFHDMRDAYDAARFALSASVVERTADMDHLHRSHGALNRAFGHMVNRARQGAEADVDTTGYEARPGAYGYIPFDVPRFLSMLVRLDQLLQDDPDYTAEEARYRPVSFLEVGCGPGRNLLIFKECKLIEWRALCGFDINPDQVEIGRRAFGLERELQVADAMTFDYGGFDVVFSYRPFSRVENQQALEAHMAASMRTGAYLLAPGADDLNLYRELTPIGTATDIWKKTG